MSKQLIVSEHGGNVTVSLHHEGQVEGSAHGEAETFTSPLSDAEREHLRWYLEDYLLAPYAVYGDQGRAIENLLPRWGERLFDALFGAGRRGRDSYLRAIASGPSELWISSSSPSFQSLPWELMQDPVRSGPLALDFAELNRTIACEREAVPVLGERLRVLMVIARPGGTRDVGFATIAQPLLQRLDAVAGEVRLDVLRPPTWDALRRQLDAARDEGEPYHILHFDGHGTFGRQPAAGAAASPLRFGDSYLVFETELGAENAIAASAIAPALAAAQVPLVVLNCQSGMLAGPAKGEVAVGTGLLAAGAAAVVAMSYNVYAVAAAEFVATFYASLFTGRTAGQAVTAGRRHLCKFNSRPSPKGDLPLADWIVPVHYARRAVSFPELRRQRRSGRPALAAELVRLRNPRTVPAAVLPSLHPELQLATTGGAFLGRDAEILEIDRALRLQHVVVVYGLGGSGKTQLALAFARWLQATGGLDDPSWVFVHSFEPGIATYRLSGVVDAVGLRLFGPDFARQDEASRRQLLLSALRRHRMLFVWDNFESVLSLPAPGQATPPLDEKHRAEVRRFLAEVASDARGGILITSRSPETWLGGAEIHRLQLRGLAPADVLQYAEALLAPIPQARERRSDPAYPRLLEALDGHPLSLRLLLPQLEHASAQDLLDGILGHQPLVGSRRDADVGSFALAGSVLYSVRQLPIDDQARLPMLALFEGVADEGVLAHTSAQLNVPERFRGVDKDAWGLTLQRCAAAGLLTPLGAGLYSLHPILAPFLIESWRDQAESAFETEIAATRAASRVALAALADWITSQIERGSAEAAMRVLSLERRALGAAAAEALKAGSIAQVQSILQALNSLFDTEGSVGEARSWVNRCRDRVEGADGRPPALQTPEGQLWLFVLGSEADRTLQSGKVSEAEAEYERILAALEASSPSPDRTIRRHLATVYRELGTVAGARGDLDAAASWYHKSLAIDEELGNRLGAASTYHQLGIVAQAHGTPDAAEDCYRKSLEIKEVLGNRPGMASAYHQLGVVAQDRGDLDTAESWYRKSLEVNEALGNRSGMASTYHHLGLVAQDRGDLDTAESWYRKSLESKESLGNRAGLTSSYHQLGIIAQLRGDLDAAVSWYRKSLEIKEALGDQPGLAASYHQLGIVAQLRGDLDAAESWYRKSLEINDVPGNKLGMASTYHQLGRVHENRGDLTFAETWYRKSLEHYEAVAFLPGVASTYHALGRVSQGRGAFAEAERWYRMSLETNETLGNRRGIALTLGQLGLLAEERGDQAAALNWTVRCVTLFPDFPHPATVPGPHHLARLTAILGLPALEATWLRVTGWPLPQSVRDYLV